MARTYARDNRGRFASSGATARGGRLKTASGAKRKGSTMRAAGKTPAGAMKGKVKRDPWIRKERFIGQGEKWVGKWRHPGGKTRKPRARTGRIGEAKAERIISRLDANRPGMTRAGRTGRKDANSVRTHQRAVEFALGPSRRALKRGSAISASESVRRAVKNAAGKPRRR